MQSPSSLNPYARPLGRRWYAAFAVTAVAVALALGLALWAERWLLERRAFKQALAVLIQPYQELFLAGLPGAETAEYVVFLDGDARRADIRSYFTAQTTVYMDREGSLPGTIVVTLGPAGRAGLDELRAQPFVRLVVRNQGVFFCH